MRGWRTDWPVIRVTLSKDGSAPMRALYSGTSANWIIDEWHGRLHCGIVLELVEPDRKEQSA